MASYRFHHHEPIPDAVRRIATAQLERALASIDDEDVHAAVHDVRKRGKKVRALLRLVRDAEPALYDRENAAIRDAARVLSDLRDAASDVATLDDVRAEFAVTEVGDAFAAVRSALVERRDDLADRDGPAVLADARERLEAVHERVADWQVDVAGWEVLGAGLARTHQRARDRREQALREPTSEGWHEWRKRVKYHRYHVRLLQDAFPTVLRARRETLHDLSDLLGDDNDRWELREVLLRDVERFGGDEVVAVVVAVIDRQRAACQRQAMQLGTRVFAEPTDAVADRLGAWWRTWQDESRGAVTLTDPVIAVGD